MRFAPLASLLLFIVLDALANWRVISAKTVSEWVWQLGWPTRVAAACVMLVLLSHLLLEWPYGPRG